MQYLSSGSYLQYILLTGVLWQSALRCATDNVLTGNTHKHGCSVPLHLMYFTLSLISECRDIVHPVEFSELMRLSILSLQTCIVNTILMSSSSCTRLKWHFWEDKENQNSESGPGPGTLIWTSWSNPRAEGGWGTMFSSKFIHSMEKWCSLERAGGKKEEGKGQVESVVSQNAKISLRAKEYTYMLVYGIRGELCLRLAFHLLNKTPSIVLPGLNRERWFVQRWGHTCD